MHNQMSRCSSTIASPVGFWDMLWHGGDAITHAPADRCSYQHRGPQAYRQHFGGFLGAGDAAAFDCRFFNISANEVTTYHTA